MECFAESLSRPAVHLPFDNHEIDDHAAVMVAHPHLLSEMVVEAPDVRRNAGKHRLILLCEKDTQQAIAAIRCKAGSNTS